MSAFIFRKMEIDKVNYYQLINEVEEEDLESDDEITDFSHRNEKDYFYLKNDGVIDLPDARTLNIYYDSPNGFTNLPPKTDIFKKVFDAFAKQNNIIIKSIKPIKEVATNVSKRIMFQEEAIIGLIHRIYMNQKFVFSDLPIELKQFQKKNILFHGLSGSGKKTIVKYLEKEINIPYANITLSTRPDENVNQIIDSLMEHTEYPEEASCGIVFIQDNFEQLMDILKSSKGLYSLIDYITSKEVVSYNGKDIDFRTITFVILYDDDIHEESISEFRIMTGCEVEIATKVLTTKQKYMALYGKYGIINSYDNFLKSQGFNFDVDDKCLIKLIKKANIYGSSMGTINQMINLIVSSCTFGDMTDVAINDENIDLIMKVIESVYGTVEKAKKKKVEKYLFEKRVDQIFNEARKYVIGQDINLKLLITDIVSNQMIANDNSVIRPESRKLNVLIRGGTGTGKTFMIQTVCNILDIPFAEVDTTGITETGYAGDSVNNAFIELLRKSGNDIQKAERGIVFMDEIDKKASGDKEVSEAVREAVLHEMLKPSEGGTVRLNLGTPSNPDYLYFNTAFVTFIYAGSFNGIEKIRDERLGKKLIGFGNSENNKVSIREYMLNPKIDPNITNDDYIKFGMTREFMGRVAEVIDQNEVTKEMFINIMKNGELNSLKNREYLFKLREIDVEFTDGFIEELANIAVARNQGVRGLTNALGIILKRLNHQDIRASEVEKIILNEKAIYDPSELIIIERGRQKQKKIKN